MADHQTTTSIHNLEPGQVWREEGQDSAWACEIISVTSGGLSSVEWRRPGGAGVRWCESRRFRNWIKDTRATVA